MFEESVAVRTVGEWKVENLSVFKRLLHPIADRVIVVLCFDDGERDIWFVGKDVVGFLRFPSLYGLAAHDYAALREVGLLANLGHQVPLFTISANECGGDELGPNVRFSMLLFVH